MALAPESLKAPEGHLEPAVFPDIELDTYLTGWISQASSKADSEEAQTAYVYYLAFSWKSQKSADDYADQDIDGLVSVGKTDKQRATWKELADYWLAQYGRLASEAGEKTDVAQPADYTPVHSRR